MAEDLDIRSVWNRTKEKEDPSSLKIDKLERKGTRTTLYWIKIILWIECAMTILLMPFLIIYMSNKGDSFALIAAYVCINVIYLFYYQFLIHQIRKFNYAGNVLQSLKKVYGYLWFYLMHYKVVLWISMIFGFIYGLYDPANAEVMSKIKTTEQWVKMLAFSAVLLGIVGAIFHLLLHLVYGRKIKRLKRRIKDLEKEG